jgi:hypothetical protein
VPSSLLADRQPPELVLDPLLKTCGLRMPLAGGLGYLIPSQLHKTKEPTITNDMMPLRTHLEKSSDADLLRELIDFTAQRDGSGGGGTDKWAPGKRSPVRINHHNGYRDLIWETRTIGWS